ncbi:MAG: PQQ-binding-like beta-propeller repeat protein, partial [Phycisphaeraceae bacterium JB051]
MSKNSLQSILRFGQWVTITFIIVLGALMTHDAHQRENVLSNSQAQLQQLKSANLDDPSIAQTARDLDYLYRSAYFQTQDRQAYGFMLLGIGFLILCLLLVFDRYRFAPELVVPKAASRSSETERKALIMYAVSGVAGLAVILFAVQMTVFKVTHTRDDVTHQPKATATNQEQSPPQPILLTEALQEATHHWPGFKGSLLPNQNARPEHWHFKAKWQTPIALPGFNSPVIWGDLIFVAGGDQTQRTVYCFDARDGKQLWQASCTTAPIYPDLTDDTGVAAPTLCVDNTRVYGIFATGEMICTDHAGNVIWQRQLPTPDIMYGYASSPLLLGDRL